jgi:hypothetical protein
MINTQYRSTLPEIMDEFDLQGDDLRQVLCIIDRINAVLGGDRVTINGIKKLMRQKPDQKQFRIIDLGCGSGATLRKIADHFRFHSQEIELTGIDANHHTIDIAQELSQEYHNIRYLAEDIFSEDLLSTECDIAISCLTMHHFRDKELMNLIARLHSLADIGVVINDLHRHKWAYRLFQLYCKFFVDHEIAANDGKVSILRGFKRADIEKYASELNLTKWEVRWFWAFRYQWIIEK